MEDRWSIRSVQLHTMAYSKVLRPTMSLLGRWGIPSVLSPCGRGDGDCVTNCLPNKVIAG